MAKFSQVLRVGAIRFVAAMIIVALGIWLIFGNGVWPALGWLMVFGGVSFGLVTLVRLWRVTLLESLERRMISDQPRDLKDDDRDLD